MDDKKNAIEKRTALVDEFLKNEAEVSSVPVQPHSRAQRRRIAKELHTLRKREAALAAQKARLDAELMKLGATNGQA